MRGPALQFVRETPRRAVLVLGIAAVAVALYVAWSTYGFLARAERILLPAPLDVGRPGCPLRRHSQRRGRMHSSGGDESFAVVWPPGYRLGTENGEPVVHGGPRDVGMGEQVRMGGGYYEDGQPPPGTRDVGSCAPPFFLSTRFTD